MSINRRSVLAGAAVVLATPVSALSNRISAIAWSGMATVFQDAGDLELTVRTRVEPFRRARSASWITAQGERTKRTLVIEPAAGWLEQGGKRKPLPPALIAHERQQYGLYGYLLRATAPPPKGSSMDLTEPGFPPIHIEMAHRQVISADYTVGSPEDGSPLAQQIVFDGEFDPAGTGWFRRMVIYHAGKPYFALKIDTFAVERG